MFGMLWDEVTKKYWLITYKKRMGLILVNQQYWLILVNRDCPTNHPNFEGIFNEINPHFSYWLVVLTILKHMSSSMGRIIPYGKYKMLESTNQNNMGLLTIIGNWCWTIVGEYSSFCVSSIPVTIQQALVLY
jgi:hypothetical protein